MRRRRGLRPGGPRPAGRPPAGDVALHFTARAVVAAPVALVCMILSLMTSRPEYAVLGAGPLLVVLLSIGRPTPRVPSVDVDVSPTRCIENDRATLRIRLSGLSSPADVDVHLEVPDGVQKDTADVISRAVGSDPLDVTVSLVCRRWGSHAVGVGRLTVSNGAMRVTSRVDAARRLIVLPEPERLRSMISPRRPQQTTGHHPSATRGPGIEFADLRRFRPGDRPRDINWRATARRGGLEPSQMSGRGDIWVNDRHPDRGGDVILLLDSVEDAGGTTGATLDAAVRAAASVADTVLRVRDRVGFVGLGGRLRWLAPGGGLRQWYRLAETLVAERPAVAHVGAGLSGSVLPGRGDASRGQRPPWLRGLPPRVLPPDALVVALSPLLDEAVVAAVLALGARGTDVVVVEIDPADVVAVPERLEWDVARRLWHLERAVLRRHLAAAGITVVRWSPHEPFAEAVAEAVRLRRRSSGRGGRRPARLG